MVVHPHPLSPVQSPLVLVSPRICHPDEKRFRRLNQGRFSPGPPRHCRRRCHRLLLLLLPFIGPGSPRSYPSNWGRAKGAVGGCVHVCVCVSAWCGWRRQCGEWKKIYSCREWDCRGHGGCGMGVCFPSITVTAPHLACRHTHTHHVHAHIQGCKHEHKQNGIQNQIYTLLCWALKKHGLRLGDIALQAGAGMQTTPPVGGIFINLFN